MPQSRPQRGADMADKYWIPARPFVSLLQYYADDLAETPCVIALAIGLSLKQSLDLCFHPTAVKIALPLAQKIYDAKPKEIKLELTRETSTIQIRKYIKALLAQGCSNRDIAGFAKVGKTEIENIHYGYLRNSTRGIELRLLEKINYPQIADYQSQKIIRLKRLELSHNPQSRRLLRIA